MSGVHVHTGTTEAYIHGFSLCEDLLRLYVIGGSFIQRNSRESLKFD